MWGTGTPKDTNPYFYRLGEMLSTLTYASRRTPQVGSGSWFEIAELLKMQEKDQFPHESVKIEVTQIHSVGVLKYYVEITDIKEMV